MQLRTSDWICGSCTQLAGGVISGQVFDLSSTGNCAHDAVSRLISTSVQPQLTKCTTHLQLSCEWERHGPDNPLGWTADCRTASGLRRHGGVQEDPRWRRRSRDPAWFLSHGTAGSCRRQPWMQCCLAPSLARSSRCRHVPAPRRWNSMFWCVCQQSLTYWPKAARRLMHRWKISFLFFLPLSCTAELNPQRIL